MPLPPPPLVDALIQLASAAGVDLDRTQADQVVAHALVPDADPGTALLQAAAAAGLLARTVALSPEEITGASVDRLLPAVVFAADGRPLLALRRSFARIEILDLGEGHARHLLGPRELAVALGREPSAKVPWIVADPQRGLDPLSRALHGDGTSGPTPLARLWGLLRIERDDVGVSLVYALGVGLLSIATPVGVQVLVNTVAFGALLQPLAVLTMLVAAGLLSAGALHALQFWVVERLQQRIFARVALDLAHRLPRLRLDALDGRHGPELVNRFFDVVNVQKGVSTLLVEGIGVALQTTVGLVLLAFYHPLLLGFDLFLLATLGLIFFVLGRGATETAIKESKHKYALAAWLQETVRHVHAFRLQGGESLAQARAESLTRAYVTTRRKHFTIVFRQYGAALVLQAIASAVLLGVGGALVIGRQLTLGQLVAAELIVTALVASFSKFGKYFETAYDLLAGLDKIGTIIDLPVEGFGGLELPWRPEGIQLRAADVSLEQHGQVLVPRTSIDVRPGRRVAVLGANGSGKSILVDVLAGLRAPSSGRLDVDGVDARELEATSFRRQVAVVREADIYAGTLADNLRHGRLEITRHDLRRVLESLGIWELVSSMPDGLDTVLPTRAAGLPSGLVTLLVLARALAGRPRLLVLDGVLDALDKHARQTVFEAVQQLTPRASLVVTTSDPAVTAACDDVYRLSRNGMTRNSMLESTV